LRKHMETNHATNVLVTSTTTIPAAAAPATAAAQAAAAAASAGGGVTESISVTGSALYTCNHCQFKSTDKGVFDEHMRKHVTNKPKPFKCRLCSQRFETREAATVHNCRRHTDAGAAQGNQDLQVHLVRLQDLRYASVQYTL